MQVANALNNSIRILFNPRVEPFKLFDFLIVKSDDSRYLGQIVEIYDDKFDSSQDVAKIRLFYKINNNNEVMPYDNFTPNRECEIVKINQDEIENFINQDKETFIFATNMKNQSALNVQYDFFTNNCVILADKIENSISISVNIAKNLSSKKHVVIVDCTGVLEYDKAKKIKACSDFKIPLNYSTIDIVYEKCLHDSSLEFQSIGGEIINEIKKFARRQEAGFIPFNTFTKVLLEQYKATPYSELKLLLTRIKKHQMDTVFARTKKESEALQKTIQKNPITIIDLSNVDVNWQKPFMDYIVNDTKKDIYLLARINEENIDSELLHKIYDLKKNINFIPNASYSYKKLPSLMQYCKNYILMPSLYQRMDFLDANFALSNLILEGCLLFGENTDNFIYQACDYELEAQNRRKNYRKIELTLPQTEHQEAAINTQNNVDYYENQQENSSENQYVNQNEINQEPLSDSQRLMNELSAVDYRANEHIEPQITENEEPQNYEKDFEKSQIEQTSPAPSEFEKELQQAQDDKLEETQPEKQPQEDIKQDTSDDYSDLKIEEETAEQSPVDITNQLENHIRPRSLDFDNHDEFEKIEDGGLSVKETKDEADLSDKNLNQETKKEDTLQENTSELKEETPKTKENNEQNLNSFEDLPTYNENLQTQKNEPKEEKIQDEELDFYQMPSLDTEAPKATAQETVIQETKLNIEEEADTLDLSEVANNSIDNNFENIINKTPEQKDEATFDLSSDNKIDINNLTTSQNENLPIFKEEEKNDTQTYAVGNVIVHKKYGRGKVVKLIKYEQRQLLQIEFEESGKKLLDPKVADIKLEQ